MNKVNKQTLHYFWQAYMTEKPAFILSIISVPIIVLINNIFWPLVLADIIDKVSSGVAGNDIATVLLPEVIVFLILFIISRLSSELVRLRAVWGGEIRAMDRIAVTCFDTISAQSMQFHNNRFSGSLVSQVNKFIGAFETFSDVLIWDAMPLVVTFIATFIILGVRSPLFAIILALFVIGYTVIVAASNKKINILREEEASASTRQTGQLADSITNINSVKSYAREELEHKRYSKYSHKWRDASLAVMNANMIRNLCFSVLIIILIAAILFFMLYGRDLFGLSVSTLVLIVTYSEQTLGRVWDINHIFKHIAKVFGDAREMTMILSMEDDVVDAEDATELTITDSSVNFDHISFRHADAKEAIFEDFSLEIKPGERVGLVGVSGSGKTTLTRLLLRFADVNEGAIKISNQDISKVTQKSLREAIAYVPQETSLFHRSIAENIAYGKPDASFAEIKRAAELANADEFIVDLPNGYETLVGERGVKLSGGQRQRVVIARAILKDAPILVLDEATSALDSESEALIQDALNTLMKGRTSIVVAHRLSTIAGMDRIIVLEDGKIVEQGSHKELLEKPNGVYHHLWSRQSGAFMDEN